VDQAEAEALVQSLVQDLGADAGDRALQGAGADAAVAGRTDLSEDREGPLAADDGLDHARDRGGAFGASQFA
jgi:hypothetical protein